MTEGDNFLGQVLDLDVGVVGHGGFCVARLGDDPHGRVVFVRHALPGERVRAQVTEDAGGSFLRADAIAVLVASPDRVAAPCPHAGPGHCGGCDWQHAAGPAQRKLKHAVVREQFDRLAGVDVSELLREVEQLPGGLLGWRTRIAFAVGADGVPGLRRHRSHEIEKVPSCPLGVAGVGDAPALSDRWSGASGIEAIRDDDGALTLLTHRPSIGRRARGRRPPDRVSVTSGPKRLRYRLGERMFTVDATGFWQVHPHAAGLIAQALTGAVAPRPGETVLELYSGAGPLTSVLADALGPQGRVLGFESSALAVADAADNLAVLPWAQVRHGRVNPALLHELELTPDVVVVDPPRAGVGSEVMAALLGRHPRAIGYVSCDPATLARDIRVAIDSGWRLTSLRAFDAFPMTHHVECLAGLEPDGIEKTSKTGEGSSQPGEPARTL